MIQDKAQSAAEIRKLPAARGLAWLLGSWALFRMQPLRLLLISLFFQLFLSFSQTQALGLVVILCLPVFTAGMLHALFTVEQGGKPALALLFMPFAAGKNFGRLLLLGALVLVVGLLVVSLVLAGQVVDIDAGLLSRIEQGDLDALQLIDPQLMQSAIMAMVIGAAISGSITYFSVPLIWFRKQGVISSVQLGLRALFRNWRPLLVIGLLLGLVAAPIALLLGYFYLAALGGSGTSSWLAVLLLLLGPLFQLLLFGTQYLAFRDIFGLDGDTTGKENPNASQLVA